MRTKTNDKRRPSRRTNSTASKIVSAGLATATCVGLVGVIGVRTAQDSAAADSSSATEAQASAVAAPTSTDGYTQAELDAYAAQLAAEAQRLTDYRAQLAEARGGGARGLLSPHAVQHRTRHLVFAIAQGTLYR